MNHLYVLFAAYPDLVTTAQMQLMLGIGEKRCYQLIRNHHVIGFKIGNRYRIIRNSISDYVWKQCEKRKKSSEHGRKASRTKCTRPAGKPQPASTGACGTAVKAGTVAAGSQEDKAKESKASLKETKARPKETKARPKETKTQPKETKAPPKEAKAPLKKADCPYKLEGCCNCCGRGS